VRDLPPVGALIGKLMGIAFTVEYFHAEGSLDGYIARLLEAKITLLNAVAAEDFPDASIIAHEVDLRRLAPALIEEVRLTRAATLKPFRHRPTPLHPETASGGHDHANRGDGALGVHERTRPLSMLPRHLRSGRAP
jgi:hypothetical protein